MQTSWKYRIAAYQLCETHLWKLLNAISIFVNKFWQIFPPSRHAFSLFPPQDVLFLRTVKVLKRNSVSIKFLLHGSWRELEQRMFRLNLWDSSTSSCINSLSTTQPFLASMTIPTVRPSTRNRSTKWNNFTIERRNYWLCENKGKSWFLNFSRE